LLDWLRVSAQASIGENGRLQTPLTSTALQAPLADQDLQQHILSTLHCALPQLRSVSSTSDMSSAILTLATNVAENTMLTNQGREARQNATTALKLPSYRFKTTLPLLLNTLLVEDEDDLPPLWHQLANADKKQDFLIIRDALDTFANSDDSFIDKAPIVSNKLKDDLITFTWHGTSHDDFEMGLSPFAIMDGNDSNRAQNVKLAKTYGLLANSDVHLNYADLQLLEEKDLRSLPLTYFELK
jgi:hypothetical protein